MSKKRSKRYVDPMAPLNQDNLPITFFKEDLGIKLPNLNRDYIGDTGSSEYVGNEFQFTGYDDEFTYKEDIPYLEQIRGENQGFFSALGNSIGRAAINVIPTVIGNTASILDFEDYINQDNEVGNSITRAMEDFKQSVNKDYLPLYGEATDMGDTAWWLSRGSSLVESIGAFAATGAGLGAGFNVLGKGLSTIKGLSNLGQAGKIAATVLSSTGLNQAESITTAMQVYDTTYNNSLQQGKSDQEAKEDASDAASYSININRANIALNLTSAGAFIRSPKLTRQVREAFGYNKTGMLSEGIQEYAEETINYIAQKEGERYGEAKSKNKDYKFDVQNAINDALSAEGIEAGVMGFIGGAGQTALTSVYNKLTGEADRQNELSFKQQESLDRINQLQESELVPNISNVFKSVEENVALQKEIQDSIIANNPAKTKELQYQLLDNQLADALANGTVGQLESVYNSILNLTPDQAKAKGLDITSDSEYNYKKKARQALDLISDVEDSYLNLANQNYLNFNEVLNLDIQNKGLTRLINELNTNLITGTQKVLSDKFNNDIEGDINAENVSEELKNLESYKEYIQFKTIRDQVKNTIKTNRAKFAEVTSKEYQNKLIKDQQEIAEKEIKKEEAKIAKEEEKQVKKNQQESKKKVKAAQVKKNEVAETEEVDEEFNLEEATFEEPPINDIPVPSVADIPLDEQEEGLPAEFLFSADEPTTEDIVVTKILDQEEISDSVNELKNDGLVRLPGDLELATKPLKYLDETIKRTVGNTVISLNIPYIEVVLGDVDTETNVKSIYDTYDDSGNIQINENFDSRLQSPNQFSTGTELNIIIPVYDQLNKDNYSITDYNNNINDVDYFPIAFTDNSGKVIGYLPTQENIKKRVDPDHLEVELAKNKAFRETIFNNKDKQFSVTITAKSTGSLIANRGVVKKSIYSALGNGEKLADEVTIAIQKDSILQTAIGKHFDKKIINKEDLEDGFVYTVVPTAKKGSFIALPADISKVSREDATTVLKMIQLFKANPNNTQDANLIKERKDISNEVDFDNILQTLEAINSILYTSEKSDTHMLKFGKKLFLGVSKDLTFNWNDVMYDSATQDKIVDILSNRYYSVQLSKFGKSYKKYQLVDNKLSIQKYNNYFDYINNGSVITTNIQGIPVEGTDNEYYFTAQSVIEITDPVQTILQLEETSEEEIEVETKSRVNVVAVEDEVKPVKKSNKMGIKYKPNKNKNTPQIDDDITSFNTINNIKDIDKQAQELMNKCRK